jgi:hypothetical protein
MTYQIVNRALREVLTVNHPKGADCPQGHLLGVTQAWDLAAIPVVALAIPVIGIGTGGSVSASASPASTPGRGGFFPAVLIGKIEIELMVAGHLFFPL